MFSELQQFPFQATFHFIRIAIAQFNPAEMSHQLRDK